MPMNVSVIITAGGIGQRMGAKQPKQFIALNDKPILIYTIECFQEALPDAQFILTLPQAFISFGEQLLETHAIKNVLCIAGGKERFHSISNALALCTGEYIAVHDGVRPFVSKVTIEALLKAAFVHKAAIPFLEINDSLRKVKDGTNVIVPRNEYVTLQTPQCFEANLLKEAYKQKFSVQFTDDASVVEQAGNTIFLVPGNPENIKITTPFDLEIAKLFI